MLRSALWTIVFLLTGFYSNARDNPTLTIADGLSQGMVTDIIQDSRGFLWIATQDGLNRYDGYDIKVYTFYPDDEYALSDFRISCLMEDSRGFIWVGTTTGGVNVFDPETERFYHIRADDSPGVQTNHIVSFKEDKEGNILVGSLRGLDKIYAPERAIQPGGTEGLIRDSLQIIPLFTGDEVHEIFITGDTVLLGTRSGLWSGIYPLEEEPVPRHELNEGLTEDQTGVYYIVRDNYGQIWAMRPHGLTCITNEGFVNHMFEIPSRFGIIGFDKMEDGSFILGGKNVSRYLPGPGGQLAKQRELIKSDNAKYFNRLFADRSGLLWVSTSGYGLIKYNFAKGNFGHHLHGRSVRFIESDDKDRLFVVRDLDLLVIDIPSGSEINPDDIPADLFRSHNVVFDSKGNYWFHVARGRNEEQLVQLDPNDPGGRKAYSLPGRTDKYSEIVEDSRGSIWMNSNNGHLLRLDPESGKVSSFNIFEFLHAPGEYPLINSLVQTGDSTFWVGTSHGLLRLTIGDQSIHKYELFTHELYNPASLGSNFIFHIQADPQNQRYLWLGTRGGGLNRMDTETGEVLRITSRDGLPNNVIYSVLPHGEELWLSTNRGLSKYHPGKDEFLNFTPEEGLQDYEFNYYAYNKTADGHLVFGGVNGINVFRPEEIPTNKVPPLVAITEVKVNNEPLSPAVLYRDKTELHHLENQLGFSFAALDFIAPRNNQYRYLMEGIDPDWNTATPGQGVSYANLAPGNYRFRVAGSNNSGLWSEEEAVFSFVIRPPWWNTTLAHLSYVLLVILIIYGLFRFQVKRSKERHQIAYEQMTNQRLFELDRLKSQFFTNITHEIRTPLTLIIEPIRRLRSKLRDPELDKYAISAEKNSIQLMSMVNQLLDLSKVESGKMKLNKGNRNISQLVNETVDGFLPLAGEKDIELIAELPRSPIFLYFDSDKFSQIVNNLLSNAIKYCPAGGKVWVVFRSEADEDGSAHNIALEVTDTGPGIPEEYREKIFERFFQLDNKEHSSKGTGVGLSYTRQILQLMNGTISCDSPPGKGARFSVKLKLEPAVDMLLEMASGNGHLNADSGSADRVSAAGPNVGNTDRELILVVEDNTELRNYITAELGDFYEVVDAIDGKDGLEKARKHLPDLVVSDLMMPLVDGMELCSQLKNHQLTSHIPVLLLTAKTSDRSRLTGYQTGADDYLTKPFNLDELLIRMRSLLDNRKRLIEKLRTDPAFFQTNAREAVAEKVNTPYDLEFLERFDAVIEDNLDNSEISTDEIARLMFLSRVQLHRKIKAITGRKTSEYMRNYRLNRAREMLKNREGNVREVAIKVGFPNRNYFSQKFKELYDLPPSSFLPGRE